MFLKKSTILLAISLFSSNLYSEDYNLLEVVCEDQYQVCISECNELSNIKEDIVHQCIYSCEDLYDKCIHETKIDDDQMNR